MQLTHTPMGQAAPVAHCRVPAPAAGVAARLRARGTLPTSVRWTAELTTSATTGRFASLHGAPGRMAIPTNAHRRPPETPT